jgi:FKBP-type peptidyl-prolyl cis-trans isomerase
MRHVDKLLLAVTIVSTFALGAGCSKPEPDEPKSDFKPAAPPPLPPGPNKLEIEDLAVGAGPEAKKGDTVKMKYKGTLMNDKEFDHGDSFEFTIGEGKVIKGWDEGIPGMKVGGKRRLLIPSEKGYGLAGSPPKIPPNAGLKFEVELLEIKGVTGPGAGDAGKPDAKK